jgi:glutathione S-transferase
MILIGMLDSPYVRRVAVSMTLLGHTFEHRPWSVGRDLQKIREFNPLGRTPTLVLDSGESLIESAMILDHFDDLAGPERALLPPRGDARRDAQRLIAFATGAVEKAMTLVIEQVFRPEEKRHAAWTERCSQQMHGALGELDRVCGSRVGHDWLVGDAMTQADITLACFMTYVTEAVPTDLSPYVHLAARVAHIEALPVLRQFHEPFQPPAPTAVPVSA